MKKLIPILGLNVGVLPCFGDGCFFPRFGLHLTFSHLHSDLWIFRGAPILRDTQIQVWNTIVGHGIAEGALA